MIFMSICALILTYKLPQGLCTEKAFFLRSEKMYLQSYVIKTKQTYSETECGMSCVADKSCASVNYKISGIGKGRCELNNETIKEVPDKETYKPEFIHLVIVKRVSSFI